MFLICEAVDGDFKHHKKQNLHVHSLVLIFFFNTVLLNTMVLSSYSQQCGPTESILNISLVFLREMNSWGEDSTLNPLDGVLGH